MAAERLRFNIHDDLVLMREVMAKNPYDDVNKWREVLEKTVKTTGKNFSLRAIKEHMDHLLKLWQRGDTVNIRKSGCEEQYEEKEHLLQSVSELANEFRGKKKPDGSNKSDPRKRGFDNRATPMSCIDIACEESNEYARDDAITESISTISFENSIQPTGKHSPDLPPDPPKKRSCTDSILKNYVLQFLYENHKSENSFKKKHLEFEERKLVVEQTKMELEERRISLEEKKWRMEEIERQKKLNMEIAEREQRLTMELEERNQNLKQTEQQQRIMELMFQFITKK